MKRVKTDINGVRGLVLISPEELAVHSDIVYEICDKDIDEVFVQENEVYSKKGVLRGLHINIATPQSKIIRVVRGSIFDVVVDLRKNSDTYKKWTGILLSEENRYLLHIPQGMAHGYLAMEESKVIYKVTSHYKANEEIGIAWNSKELGIEWPKISSDYIISENDKQNIPFELLDL